MAKPNKDSLKTLSFITYFIILFVFWFILSGYLKTLLLFFGVISVLFVFWMSYRAKALEEDSLPLKIILRLPFYWIWLFKEIFKSGITTTALIWNGKYSPQLITVKASQKNRTGIANYANGDVYVGEFQDDKANGHGRYEQASGEIYEGFWANDKPSGRGK